MYVAHQSQTACGLQAHTPLLTRAWHGCWAKTGTSHAAPVPVPCMHGSPASQAGMSRMLCRTSKWRAAVAGLACGPTILLTGCDHSATRRLLHI